MVLSLVSSLEMKSIETTQLLAERLARALTAVDDGVLLVVTGAGISQASGIPTFRGAEPGAIWKTSDVTLATLDYFLRDPAGQWQWYLKRFESVQGAQPNAAHRALAQLEAWLARRGGQLRLVTQNIDTLHERAGSQDLLKVHGTADRVRCSRPGCDHGAPRGSLDLAQVDFSRFVAEPDQSNLPCCPQCQSLLRAHVLFFDEYYLEHQDYRFEDAQALSEKADTVLFIGTSFAVGITDLYLRVGHRRGIPMYTIDPAAAAKKLPGLQPLAAPAEDLLPAACSLLPQPPAPTPTL